MFNREDLETAVELYETDWANLDYDVQSIALDRLDAIDLDDVISPYLDASDDSDLEVIHYQWSDLFDVVAHLQHELGL